MFINPKLYNCILGALKTWLCLIIAPVSLGLVTLDLTAQCSGNLGDNIFTDGDFGSGTANVLTPDPMIAPGYFYQPNPPPNDGFYCITNNTSNWGGFARNAWVNIGDNSNDPNGYMMVVNASFEAGLFYENFIDGLCENTLYVFSADIYNLVNNRNEIKPNVSFLLDGVEVYSTGDIPENNQWNTFEFVFTTEPDQTSLNLALRNNAPGGLGNDVALDNISFRACGPEAQILPLEIANICEDGSTLISDATIIGDQYDDPAVQWQESFDEGLTWQDLPGETSLSFEHTNLSSGMYYYRYLLANGASNLDNTFCRVNSNVKIINVVPKFWTIIDTLCQGLSFDLNNIQFDETGVYVDSLTSSIGCDSIVTLDLTIVPDTEIQAFFEVQDPSCNDINNGAIEITAINNGTPPLSIFVNDEPLQGNILSNLPVGTYSYLIEDRFGCDFEAIFDLSEPPPFIIDLGPDIVTELGCEEVRISPTASEAIGSLEWVLRDSLVCDLACPILAWYPSVSGMLSLTATSEEGGCMARDSIFVEVITARKVYIPNTFSPNFDGINDTFTIFGLAPNVQEIESFMVYDRWGQLVFENTAMNPNDLAAGWNGRLPRKNGELVPGVYVYQAIIRFLDGEKLLYKGDVLLQL